MYPKFWLKMLTSGSGVDPDIHYVLEGMLNGFRVVDREAEVPVYCCGNYNSCYTEGNREIVEL